MVCFRICSSRHPANDGEGSRLYGGRWNHKGTAVLYAAASIALCALEVLVNSEELANDYVYTLIDIPDEVSIKSWDAANLPPQWDSAVATNETKDLGTKWARDAQTAVLILPSAVIPLEQNFLLNPAHPDFKKIRFELPIPFAFDRRLTRHIG